MAVVFQDDDAGYLLWLSEHPSGVVLNLPRSGNAATSRLHRVGCRTIEGEPPRGGPWTGPYIKICADDAADVRAWANAHARGELRICQLASCKALGVDVDPATNQPQPGRHRTPQRPAEAATVPSSPDPRGGVFDLEAVSWTVTVPGAPTEETKRLFWDQAVPALAAAALPATSSPCCVVARVFAPPSASGPRGRAKGLLDALHDDRQSGPLYREIGTRPPIADDDPGHVAGLAVEVHPATTSSVEYRIGHGLRVRANLLAELDVDASAPNDIAGSPNESARISAARTAFAAALGDAWDAAQLALAPADVRAVVVHHHPGRDEDNTWSTWSYALFGAQGTSAGHWAAEAPLRGCAPRAVASAANPELPIPTRYLIYG